MKKVVLLLALLLSACNYRVEEHDNDNRPIGKGDTAFPIHFPQAASLNVNPATDNGIFYHGGPIITGTVNVYLIWYGNWTGNTAPSILTNLMTNIGGSPYFNTNTTYYNSNQAHVSNSVFLNGQSSDNYSQGTSLNDSKIETIVSDAISQDKLPLDDNGVYFVITSADVNETSGFCTEYCGWHTYGYIGGKTLKYAFIGDGDFCPDLGSCEQQQNSPNGNPAADGMASVMAHELEEATTDPMLDAWYDKDTSGECADKCAWSFGATYETTSGAAANMRLGNMDYLIQQNWVNAVGGYCDIKY